MANNLIKPSDAAKKIYGQISDAAKEYQVRTKCSDEEKERFALTMAIKLAGMS